MTCWLFIYIQPVLSSILVPLHVSLELRPCYSTTVCFWLLIFWSAGDWTQDFALLSKHYHWVICAQSTVAFPVPDNSPHDSQTSELTPKSSLDTLLRIIHSNFICPLLPPTLKLPGLLHFLLLNTCHEHYLVHFLVYWTIVCISKLHLSSIRNDIWVYLIDFVSLFIKYYQILPPPFWDTHSWFTFYPVAQWSAQWNLCICTCISRN